jgi:hypothetical protein
VGRDMSPRGHTLGGSVHASGSVRQAFRASSRPALASYRSASQEVTASWTGGEKVGEAPCKSLRREILHDSSFLFSSLSGDGNNICPDCPMFFP